MIAAIAMLITAIATDVAAHDRERTEVSRLAAARQRLAADRTQLANTAAATLRAAAHDQALTVFVIGPGRSAPGPAVEPSGVAMASRVAEI